MSEEDETGKASTAKLSKRVYDEYGESESGRWCPHVARGAASSARQRRRGRREPGVFLRSSRQTPDAVTYISLSQTGREMERDGEGEGEREREREREG
ncbi:hypothetical protein EYF80_015218 [Liparis tanakae]|uniref:Uncharacterized protein n=1 Tax=Liparis tanakae TaxID=230148 RepID=A0A4Z2IA85_9TELE|nr:hypothetical protein EYF80_015218 [Liparis tanakae]